MKIINAAPCDQIRFDLDGASPEILKIAGVQMCEQMGNLMSRQKKYTKQIHENLRFDVLAMQRHQKKGKSQGTFGLFRVNKFKTIGTPELVVSASV